MALTHTGKKNILAHASVKELREDNLKWLREISNWRSDIDQLYFYVIELKMNQQFSSIKGLYHLEKKILHHITTNELDHFNQLITDHECQLSEKQWQEQEKETLYKQQHLKISDRYRSFKNSLEQLKHEVHHFRQSLSLGHASLVATN